MKESKAQQGEIPVKEQEREMRVKEKNLKGSTGYQAGTLNGLKKNSRFHSVEPFFLHNIHVNISVK